MPRWHNGNAPALREPSLQKKLREERKYQASWFPQGYPGSIPGLGVIKFPSVYPLQT